MTTKICRDCKEIKPIERYGVVKKSVMQRDTCCMDCRNKYRREEYKKKPEHRKAIAKKCNSKPMSKAKRAAYMRNLRKENPEKVRKEANQYYAKNKEKYILHAKNRSYRKRNNLGSQIITLEMWGNIIAQQDNRCYYCKEKMKKPTMEHKIALIRGGAHCLNNIVAACLSCNCSKQALTPEEFALRQGRLVW